MIAFPSDEEIQLYADKHLNGNYVPLMRDLARMTALFHLKDEGFFDTDTVLAGGMALRCYGGSRLTMRDADTSTRLNPKAADLERLLTFEIPDLLRVEAERAGSWPKRSGMETVKPIHYDPLFTDLAMTDDARQFDITISKRGLHLDPSPQPFHHHYSWALGIEGRKFPLMDIREMIAEKVLGFAVTRVEKHYADLAVIAVVSTKHAEMGKLIKSSKALIREMVDAKLEIGREHAQDGGYDIKQAYDRVPDYGSIKPAFLRPEQHLERSAWSGAIQWIPTSWMDIIPFATAKALVTGLIYPLLFDA